jgi:hypothetical protein
MRRNQAGGLFLRLRMLTEATRFRRQPDHVDMWKGENAKDASKGYGVSVAEQWYWYQNWIDRCIELCRAAGDKYI